MTTKQKLTDLDANAAASQWLQRFEAAAAREDAKAAAALFLPDGHWRDLIAFTWHIQTMSGTNDIEAALRATLPKVKPRNFRIAENRTPPHAVKRAGVETIEAIFTFETDIGRGSGVLRLVPAPDALGAPVAWILLTSQDEIKGHEERIGKRRPRGEEYSRGFGGDNWLDLRRKHVAYEDRDPQVVIVGGGQCGLGLAACLGQLGVDTLVIDRHERVGDAWRKRYHSLTLHNEVFVNHLPYLPFPPNFPVYIPKDKIANWLEFYADAMELNVWTGTELVRGGRDEKANRWEIVVNRGGKERTLRPRHVVFATGVSAIPVKPDIPGLEAFAGEVMHSSAYSTGQKWAGRKAIVFGTGNSGHDVAHDLHESGAKVHIVQRASTLIVSIGEAQRVYEMYLAQTMPTEDCDIIATASPYPVLVEGYKIACAQMREGDKKLLQGLEARGFRLDFGPPDDTGYQMKYLRRGGGYYFNVGASDLIVDGKIGLLHYHDIDQVVANGVRMKDGAVHEADLIVTATGYKNQQNVVRHFLGDAIADRIGPVWGFDEGGEQRNMWRRTPQPGLWFTAGGLPHVRIYSKYLAQQIKACEEGLLDMRFDGGRREPDRATRAKPRRKKEAVEA